MQMQPFDTPGDALAHYGRKGMKWGVRQEDPTGDLPNTAVVNENTKTARRINAKKAAIGLGVLTAVAGGAYVAYKLNQNGQLPLSSIKKMTKPETAVKKVLAEPTTLIHAARGKTKGFRFFKSGDLADPYPEYVKAFGHDKFTDGLFERYGAGKIAASFMDPEGRYDQSKRPLHHQVIIPKGMSSSVNNIDDVVRDIWPLLKDTYDAT